MWSAPCPLFHLNVSGSLTFGVPASLSISFISPNRMTLPLTHPLCACSSLHLKYSFPSSHITHRLPYQISKPVLCQYLDFLPWIRPHFAITHAFICILTSVFLLCQTTDSTGKIKYRSRSSSIPISRHTALRYNIHQALQLMNN